MFWLVGAAATFSPGSTISPGLSRFSSDTAPHFSIQSPQQATTAALNDIVPANAGYELRNPRHSAAFTADGLHFTPRRGGPSWHWQLRHVGADATALPNVMLGPIAPQHEAPGAVAYSRGALVERYLARPGSVEQQFVIERALGLGGADLVLEGAVRSAGAFEVTPSGWLWRGSDGVVSLGGVFVYDAQARPLPATMTVTRDATRIVVDGDALERAAYPVTIDPEIGTNDFQISDMGTVELAGQAADMSTAVAYNSTSNEYLVVWAGDDIAPTVDGEFEIWGQRVNAATGAEVGSQFRISNIGTASNTSFDALKPAVTYNSTNNEYLVVWSGDTNAGALVDGEFEIYAQRINASGAEVGTNDFRISTGDDLFSYFDATDPDVTYNPTGNEYLIVWSETITATDSATNEFEIFGQRLNGATGAETGTDDFRISEMGVDNNFSFDAHTPAVAFNTTSNEYLVVWSGDDNGAGLGDEEFEIFGQRLNSTGGEIGTDDFRISEMGANGNPLFQATAPDVAYNSTNNEYLVVWEGDNPPLSEGEIEIWGQRLGYSSGNLVETGTSNFRISNMGPDNSGLYDANNAAVSYNATSKEYLVVWSGDTNATPLVDGEFEIYGQRLTAATGADAGADFRISDMGPDGDLNYEARLPAVAARSADYLVVWVGDDNSAGLVDGQFEVFGQLMTFGLPTVSNVNSVASTSGGTLTEGEATNAAITQLLVTFSTSMNVAQAETEGNYQLITDGGDGIFQTGACAAPAGDDTSVTVDSAAYLDATRTVTLTVNSGTALPEERYRLAACPTLTDVDGNQLDGNADGTAGDAFARIFRIDTTAPVLNLPEDITVTATSPSGAVVTYSATATDNGGSVPVVCSPLSGSNFAIGTTTVNCTATDAAGNVATGSFTVTVVEEGVEAANLAISAGTPSIQATVGRTLVISWTLTNGGPSAAADVHAILSLPAGLSFVSATASQGLCAPPSTPTINCDVGQLNSGASATITIVVRATTVGAKNFAVSVTSATDDPVTANNSVNQTVTVVGTKVYLPLILR